jgi:hypothetical protein
MTAYPTHRAAAAERAESMQEEARDDRRAAPRLARGRRRHALGSRASDSRLPGPCYAMLCWVMCCAFAAPGPRRGPWPRRPAERGYLLAGGVTAHCTLQSAEGEFGLEDTERVLVDQVAGARCSDSTTREASGGSIPCGSK